MIKSTSVGGYGTVMWCPICGGDHNRRNNSSYEYEGLVCIGDAEEYAAIPRIEKKGKNYLRISEYCGSPVIFEHLGAGVKNLPIDEGESAEEEEN